MKKFIFFLIFSSFSLINGQSVQIKGQVIDSLSWENLPFAQIYLNNTHGTSADQKGLFSLELPKNSPSFYVSYTGYFTKEIKFVPNKKFYKIYLFPKKESLAEIQITATGKNPANEIIEKAVKKKHLNDIRKSLPFFSFTNYYKFKITANRDSLKCELDTVKTYSQGKEKTYIDSTMYQFCQQLDTSELYMIESLTQNFIKNKKLSRKVLALKTAGFKNPFYELLQLQFSGKNPYDNYYKILFKEYLGPFSKKSISSYHYKIIDTLSVQKRKLFKIAFSQKEKPFIQGYILIDSKTYALSGIHIHTDGELIIDSDFDFIYLPKIDKWIPARHKSVLKASKHLKNLELGKIDIAFKPASNGQKRTTHTNIQKPQDVMYVEIIDSLTNYEFNKKHKLPFYALEVDNEATKRKEEFWWKYTGKKLSEREKNTYKVMDSVFESEKIETNLNKYKKLLYGKYPLGKIDLDLLRILNFNRHEGARVEINLQSNNYLSQRWKLHTYLAYGFKDKTFKYHGSMGYLLFPSHQTELRLGFTKDIEKSAVFKSLEKKSIFTAALSNYPWEKFVSYKEMKLRISSLVSQNLSVSLETARGFYSTLYPIPYHPGRIEFPNYDLSSAELTLQWEPDSEYLLTSEGRRKIKNGYPKYLWSIQTNFPALQTDKRFFLRTEIQAIFRKKFINKDYTDLKIQLGMNFGQPHIHQMFQPDFNDYRKPEIWQHIMLSKKYAFETVKDLEFLSNYIATAHLSHKLEKIKTGKNKSIDLRFTTAAAFGFAIDNNFYLGIKDLRRGLFESGIEISRLFKGLGLGFYYRYGNYAAPAFRDNLSLRFNIDFGSLLK